jgi:hypothetical protein
MRKPVVAFCLSLLLAGVAPAYDSLNVRLVGRWDSLPDNFSFGVAAQGNYAYVADYSAGLRVISVADPSHPTEVGYCDTPGRADGVAVVGDLAYVTDGDSGLRVISVADPAHPTEVGHCSTPDYAREVVVVGDYAYVGDDSGLSVISVADPAHPSEVGRYDTRYGAFGVAVAGAYAYVGNTEGMWVVSISDPTQPTAVGRYVTLGMGVAVNGDYAYVAASAAGLRVVSVTDPANPVEVGYLVDPANSAVRLAVSGNYVYVVPGLAPSGCGLRVISVADPANPVEVGHHYLGRNCVTLSGGYAYVGSGSSLAILQFYGGGVEERTNDEVRMMESAPTIVRRALFMPEASSRKPQATRLLDAAGSKVLDLHPGANDVSHLAPGVYFVRSEPIPAGRLASVVTKVIVAR